MLELVATWRAFYLILFDQIRLGIIINSNPYPVGPHRSIPLF
jgi:hypothetical protein